jgi:17beta-estradiol 17-dehydrogenase / very-long-chain 3-oxoacyl-CoA reductase
MNQIETLAFLIGLFYFYKFWSIVLGKIVYARLFQSDLKKELAIYGPGSWAVVTGASDGIGKAICIELIKAGYNIVLVARNMTKLEKCAKEMEALGAKTRCVAFDFSKTRKVADYKTEVYDKIKDLDISILVNNVGLLLLGDYENQKDKEVLDMVTVNCYAQTILTSLVCKDMVKRNQEKKVKSLVVNLSSTGGVVDGTPGFDIYGSSKKFNLTLSRSNGMEFAKDGINFTVVTPGVVSTPMTNAKEDFEAVSAEECA